MESPEVHHGVHAREKTEEAPDREDRINWTKGESEKAGEARRDMQILEREEDPKSAERAEPKHAHDGGHQDGHQDPVSRQEVEPTDQFAQNMRLLLRLGTNSSR